MNKSFRDVLFFFIVFSLIFNNIPKPIQMNFIGGTLQDKLVFYPIFIGMLYIAYFQYKYKNVLVNFDKFLKFVLIYAAITLISLLVGLFNYPYYDLVVNGPVTQIEKLPRVLEILKSFGIDADVKLLTAFWMIARTIKGLMFEIIYAFGGAYMIYCWYHDDWRTAFKILVKGVLASLVVVFGYSIIEVFYLAGDETAKEILVKITPYFHEINNPGSSRGDWPPVLWYALQLRSLFAEPSYFGIFAGFSIPFLWYCINNYKNKILYTIVLAFMAFLLFLTQARTATALLFGEMALLLLALVYFREKLMFKTVILVCLSTCIAFFSSTYFINNYINQAPKTTKQTVAVSNVAQNITKQGKALTLKTENKKTNDNKKVNAKKSVTSKTNKKPDNYLDKNFYSIFSENKRSNSARYAYIKSAFRVGLDHPVLGVGKGLAPAYMVDYFTDEEKKVGEIKRRIQRQKDVGILTAGMPILCEYARRFAETGAIGTAIYFMPLLYLLYGLFKKLKTLQHEYLFYGISLAGMLASAFSLELTGTYYYWGLLGLGYAMCFGKKDEEKV